MNHNFKRTIALFLSTLIVLSFVACGSKDEGKTQADAGSTKTTESAGKNSGTTENKAEPSAVPGRLDKPVTAVRMNGYKAVLPDGGDPYFAEEVDEELGVNDVMVPIDFWNLNHGAFLKTLSASVDGDEITFMTQFDKIVMHVGDTKAIHYSCNEGVEPEEFTLTAPCKIGEVVYAPLIATWYKTINDTRFYYSEAMGTLDLCDSGKFPLYMSATKDLRRAPLRSPSAAWGGMMYESLVAAGEKTENELVAMFGDRAKDPEAYFTGAPEKTLFNNNAYLAATFKRGTYAFYLSGDTLEDITYDEFAAKLIEEAELLIGYNAGSIQAGFSTDAAFAYLPPVPNAAGYVMLRGWMWSRRVNGDQPLTEDDKLIMSITGVSDEEYLKDFEESQSDDPVNGPEYNAYCNRQAICHAIPIEIPFAVAEYSDGSGFDVNPVVDPSNLHDALVIGEDHRLTDYDGYTDAHVRIYPEYWAEHPEATNPAVS